MKAYKQNIIRWMIVMTGVLSCFLCTSLSVAAADITPSATAETPSVMGHLPVVSSVTLALKAEAKKAGTTPPADVIKATAVASDPDGDTITYAWQWQRDQQDINGATKREYSPVAADTGHKLRVKVTPKTDKDITVPATGAAVSSDETQPYEPSISLTAHAEIKNYKGAKGLDVKPTGGNGGTLSYVSSEPLVATVDADGNLTLVGGTGEGSSTITVTEAAHGIYPTQTATTTVTAKYAMHVWDDSDYFGISGVRNLADDSNAQAGNPVAGGNGGAMTWTSSTPDSLTIDASGVARCLKTGDVSVTVSQAKHGGFPAGSLTLTAKCSTALSPLVAHAEVKNYTGVGGLDAKVTGGNSGTVSYVSSAPGVATVDSNGNLTLVSAGTTTITATEAVHDLYPEQKATTTVTVKDPLHVWDSSNNFGVNGGVRNLADGTGSSTGNPVEGGNDAAMTWTSSTPDSLAIDASGVARCLKTGDVIVTVSQAENDGFPAGSLPVTANCSTALIPLVAHAEVKNYTGVGGLDATATGGNSGTVSYVSSAPGVATVDSNGNLTLVSAGTTTITATEAVHDLYPEQKATTTVTVKDPLHVWDSSNNFGVNGGVRNLADGTGSSTGNPVEGGNDAAMTWTSSTPDSLAIDASGVARCLKTGDVSVTVSQAENDGFPAGSLPVTAQCSTALIPLVAHAAVKGYTGTSGLDARPTGGNGGTLSYVSSAPDVATVDTSGNLTLLKEGATIITATEAVHDLYPQQKAIMTLMVKDPIQTYDGGTTFGVSQKRDLSMSSKNFIKGNGGDLSYDSNNNDDLWFRNDGMAACINTGTFDATVTQAANDGYPAHSVPIKVKCSSAVTLTLSVSWTEGSEPKATTQIDPVFGTLQNTTTNSGARMTYQAAANLNCTAISSTPQCIEYLLGGDGDSYWDNKWKQATVSFFPENGGKIMWRTTINYP